MRLPKFEIDRAAIRTFFKTDRGLLLISMGISLLFWFLVKLSRTYKAQRVVEITYSLPAEKSFISIPPSKTTVTFSGRGWDLMYDYFGYRNRTINFDLTDDLTGITNGQLAAKISESLSTSITVDPIGDYISIKLGDSNTKKIPILLESDITFAANRQLQSSIVLRPDSITISGPETLLETYEFWPTARLTLNDLATSYKQPLPLAKNDKPQIQLSSEIIQVHIPVEQFTEKSLFLPVVVKNAPDSLKVFPNKVKTSFVVGLSRYDSITEKDFQLQVDLNGIPINQANNTAPLLLYKQPNVVKNVQFSPKSVKFLFVKEEE